MPAEMKKLSCLFWVMASHCEGESRQQMVLALALAFQRLSNVVLAFENCTLGKLGEFD